MPTGTIEPERAAAYLRRLGLDGAPQADGDGLRQLHRAHLRHVPFENLDIACGPGVPHDLGAAIDKIVERQRGGWCFELNGAFALLLEHLGYDVIRLGAAVLVAGPSTVLDHLTLEVSGGVDDLEPRLVDVGFGDAFDVPLELNRSGPQAGGHADFELIPSPLGTTLCELVDGVPSARYRFKRVAHDFGDFAAVAESLQSDPTKHWSTKPFATRLLDGNDRVVLTHDHLRVRRAGRWADRPVARAEWDSLLEEWFGLERPGPWPDQVP